MPLHAYRPEASQYLTDGSRLHRYDPDTLSNATNMDYLLTTLTIVPCALGFLLETPLFDVIADCDLSARLLEKVQAARRGLRRWNSSHSAREPSKSVSAQDVAVSVESSSIA